MRGFGQRKLPEDSSGELIVTKGNELSEIKNVQEFLDPDETVHIVAKQTRRKPGGALMLAPNAILVTNRRLIITNPRVITLFYFIIYIKIFFRYAKFCNTKSFFYFLIFWRYRWPTKIV